MWYVDAPDLTCVSIHVLNLHIMCLCSTQFGLRIYDTLTAQCCERLQSSVTSGDFELEAKIGVFMASNNPSRTRYTVPAVGSGYCVLTNATPAPYSFKPGLTEEDFSTLCNTLKQRLTYTQERRVEPILDYQKTHTIDSFYRVDGRRIRVSRDIVTKEVKECIEKVSICDDINVLDNAPANASKYSFRISAKREVKAPLPPPTATPLMTREKLRRSFICGPWSIDLTEVTTGDQKTYEVEVEMHSRYLETMRVASQQALTRESGTFMRMVEALIRTVKSLIMATNPAFRCIPSDHRHAKQPRPNADGDPNAQNVVQLPKKQ